MSQREVLETRRDSEYFSQDGLRTLTGLTEDQWDYAILKELLDNSLDAINDLEHKEVIIRFHDDKLAISDSGNGISEALLERIYDFNVYVSDKRDYNIPSRGCQGNALKTIIAICYHLGYTLVFLTSGKRIIKEIIKSKLNAGIIEFEKNEESTDNDLNAIIIAVHDEFTLTTETIRKTIWNYYLCNPDVTFKFNDETFSNIVNPIKRTDKTYIHWYTLGEFNQLIQKIYHKNPARTTKNFCLKFSGVQRILSSLKFPYKKLSDFIDKEWAITRLYEELKEESKKPSPNVLSNLIITKDTFLKIYGNTNGGNYKYKCTYDEYEDNDATIPYVIEGFLLNSKEEDSRAEVITSINNSVPYGSLPFYFKWHNSLKDHLGRFYEAKGITLFLNFNSPVIRFTDKAKTQIDSEKFKHELIKLTDYLTKDVIKEVKEADRKRRRFDKEKALEQKKKEKKKKSPGHEELMMKYFWEGVDHATGNRKHTTKQRQVWYQIRKIVEEKEGIYLPPSSAGVFSQKVLTYFYEKEPWLEQLVLLDARGTFIAPDGEEIPLGTKEVFEFMGRKFSIPIELLYNHALFIEKEGFNTVLKESGLKDELNLGIISSKGLSVRAAKKLIKYFLDKGMKIYVLHDCDISGYIIQDKLESGSKTFKDKLKVINIGIKVKDIKKLGIKPETALVPQYYENVLKNLNPEEKKFFDVDKGEPARDDEGILILTSRHKSQYRYRRLEINALTTPELLDFLRSKIKYKPIKPKIKELVNYIDIDKKQIVKNTFDDVLREKYKKFDLNQFDFEYNKNDIAKTIHQKIDERLHWIDVRDNVVNEIQEQKKKELMGEIKEKLMEWEPKSHG